MLLWNRGKAKPGVIMFNGQGELKGHRFHLRIDPEEKGVLLIDAAKLLFLNDTAMAYVKCLLEGKSDRETIRFMRKRYRNLSKEQAMEHYLRVKKQLSDLMAGRIDVVEHASSDNPLKGADDLPSPYRMDLALTYRCQNDCEHCYNENKSKKELNPDDWKKILDILWAQGIPHVVFTGGEPTLYPHLKEIIVKSEELGQITGLVTNGRNLANANELVKAGLDHVQITLLSHRESVHDRITNSVGAWHETISGIKTALKGDLYVSTNTTIMRSTLPEIEDTMRFIVALGVKNVAFNSIIRSGKGKSAEAVSFEELADALTKLKTIAGENGINLIWYAPTPYCEFNPINYGLGIKQCTACSINMAIEPDGTVLPCQSFYEPLGNILKDPWESIWNHETCVKIRERGYMPDKCNECNLWDLCGGGCPLAIEHGDYLCMDRHSNP